MTEIALIGKKIGMAREFYKSGQLVPVTVIKMEKARVIQIIDKEKRGYKAVQLGFGKITNVLGLGTEHAATVGRLSEVSIGNDSTTGHWEIAGLITTEEFKTFPDGFPHELISKIEDEIDFKFIGNIHASGTEIIKDLGEQHMETKELILYTSGDSVFQIAAHAVRFQLENTSCVTSLQQFIDLFIIKWQTVKVNRTFT